MQENQTFPATIASGFREGLTPTRRKTNAKQSCIGDHVCLGIVAKRGNRLPDFYPRLLSYHLRRDRAT